MGTKWFDEKYRNGGRATLADKAELFREIGIPLSDRAKRIAKEKLTTLLYELRREYSPGNHMLAHNLLFCLGPSVFEKEEYGELTTKYKEAIKRHQNEIVFQENFD